MIITEFYRTREDGVNLFRTLDAQVDENGRPLEDESGNHIPTGFKIRKVIVLENDARIQTDEIYDDAIDVENAPFKYEPTDIPVESAVSEQVPSETDASLHLA